MTETASQTGRSALAGHLHVGRIGRAGGAPGVTVRERTDVALASITAAKGKAAELAARIKARTAIDLPTTPRALTSDHLTFAWTAPGQWLAQAEGEDGASFAADLARDLAGLAAVTDQTDGRVLLRVAGPKVRDMLAKGCMLDVHPAVFGVGVTAVTQVALLTLQITRQPDADDVAVFDLAVMRSFATSLWHWLESSAAEYGLDVT